MIDFFVPGAPVPGGSKRAFPIHGRDGKLHVAVADTSGPRGHEWRAAIRLAAANAVLAQLAGAPAGTLFRAALRLSLCFYLPRPVGHLGKHGLRASADAVPMRRPDVLKLARAVEDACTGVLWRDDAQIVAEELHKVYADPGAPIGVRISVAPVATHSSSPTTTGHPCHTKTA